MALDGKVQGFDLYGSTPPKGVNPTENKGIEPLSSPVKNNSESNSPAPTASTGGIPRGVIGTGIGGGK